VTAREAPIEHGGRRLRDVPASARDYQGHRAGIVSRLGAAVVDVVVVAAVLAAAWVGVFCVRFALDSRHASLPSPGREATVSIASGFAVVYLAACWWTTGRTYGDHLLGLRVVGMRGHRPGVLLATLRAVGYVVFPIGLLWTAVSRQNRSVQDLVLRTSVIYDWTAQPESVRREGDPVR
jgi:uncharacterized RDD family membrane protein YckC